MCENKGKDYLIARWEVDKYMTWYVGILQQDTESFSYDVNIMKSSVSDDSKHKLMCDGESAA